MSRGNEKTAARAHAPSIDDQPLGGMIGASEPMQQLFRIIRRIAPLDLSVLVQGETGTGKELAARAIHDLSPRRHAPFLVVDCGGIAPNLIESELFGHEKGAFTGASSSRPGAFERAQGGTILLDELGELTLDLQPKLLRVLESREVWRIGGNEVIPLDVRLIAATNRDLTGAIASGAFREDLYYRLAVINLSIPPLRRRREDIPELVDHLLAHEQQGPRTGPKRLTDDALRALGNYAWPGNVRELRNVVSQLLAFSDQPLIDVDQIPTSLKESTGAKPDLHLEGQFQLLGPGDDFPSFKEAKERLLATFERGYIEATVRRAGGNISRAARTSGLHRKSIERLIKKHGLNPREAK
jgi:DNA-binding NtrC family response regulator